MERQKNKIKSYFRMIMSQLKNGTLEFFCRCSFHNSRNVAFFSDEMLTLRRCPCCCVIFLISSYKVFLGDLCMWLYDPIIAFDSLFSWSSNELSLLLLLLLKPFQPFRLLLVLKLMLLLMLPCYSVTVFAVLNIDVLVARAGEVVAGVEDPCDSIVIFSSGALKSLVFFRGGVWVCFSPGKAFRVYVSIKFKIRIINKQ